MTIQSTAHILKVRNCLSRLPDASQERGGMMEDLARYVIILAVFLGVSWIMRLIISQDTARRINRKEAEEKAGFCVWPRDN